MKKPDSLQSIGVKVLMIVDMMKMRTYNLILLTEKMRGMKKMREEGGMRGIGREETIEDMEVDKERKELRE